MDTVEELRKYWKEVVEAYSLHWFLSSKLKALFDTNTWVSHRAPPSTSSITSRA